MSKRDTIAEDWEALVRRVDEQIRRVGEVNPREAYLVCNAHAKVMARLLVESADDPDDALQGMRLFFKAFVGDVSRHMEARWDCGVAIDSSDA